MSDQAPISYLAPAATSDDQGAIAPDRIRLVLVFAFVSALVWIAFATLAVPPLIHSAYRGESLPVFNRMIRGQHVHPVGHYLQVWGGIATTVLVSWLGVSVLPVIMSTSVFFRRFVGAATPGTLGAIRAWTCFILLLTTLQEDLSSFALLPPEIRQPMGLMNVLYVLPIGYAQFLASETSLRLFQRVTEVLLFLGVIGWRTRIVIPFATLCAFILNGILREYTGFWHQNLVPIYVLAVLSWT